MSPGAAPFIMLRMAHKRKALTGVIAGILLAVAAGYASWDYTRGLGSPAPLGTPLPEVVPAYEILPREQMAEASLNQRRIPEAMLEMLAMQPDGSPPLRYTINCELADFIIRHPYGAQTISFPVEEVQKDKTLIEAIFKFDQPIKMLKYTAENRQEGESVVEYAARLHDELEASGVEFYPDTTPFDVDEYHFEHFEYRREAEDGETRTHYIYIGQLGRSNALVMNFISTPELHERARPMVLKIIGSFIPGWKMLSYLDDGSAQTETDTTDAQTGQ